MKYLLSLVGTFSFISLLFVSVSFAVEEKDADMDYPQVKDQRFIKDIDVKEFKCSKRVAYKYALPGVSAVLTKEPAIQTAIGKEKYDIEAGLARVIDKQVHCSGYGLVVCTAVVTICYK